MTDTTTANIDSESTAADQAETRRLTSNIAYLVFGSVGMNAALFLQNWALIFWFGQSIHADLVWILAAAKLGMLISDLGPASKAGIRTIARMRGNSTETLSQTIASLAVVQIVFAMIPALSLLLAADYISQMRPGINPAHLRLTAVWIMGYALIKTCTMVCVGLEQMFTVMIINPLVEIVKLAWVFICIAASLGLGWILLGWTGAYVVSILIALPLTRSLTRRFTLRIRPRMAGIKESFRILAESFPYYISTLGMFGVPFAMEFFVGIQFAEGQTSLLQVVFSLAAVSRLISTPVATATFPRYARADVDARAGHNAASVLSPVVRLLGLVSTFAFAAFWMFGGIFLAKVYGAQYLQALPAMLILTVSVGIENYTQQLDQFLMAKRYVRLVASLEALKYVVMMSLAFIFVPESPITGAATSVLIAVAINAVIKIILAKRLVGHVGGRPFLASVLVFAIVAAAGIIPDSNYLVLPAWLVAASALKLLRLDDLRRWTRRLRR